MSPFTVRAPRPSKRQNLRDRSQGDDSIPSASSVTAASVLSSVGVSPAVCSPNAKGFRISRSSLTLRAKVPNLDEARFYRNREGCLEELSCVQVLKAEITLDAKLV